MPKNKRDLIISSILILVTLIWLFINEKPFFEVVLLFLVFGVLGSLGAVFIDLKFHNINRLAKYFINTLWVGLFITLYVTYIISSSETTVFLSAKDKIILVIVYSLIPTLFSFVLQYVFFVISFIIIVQLKNKEIIP